MQIAVVLVHYHTPHLLQRAIDALQQDAQVTGLQLEGVVVDNGSRPEDTELLASLPFRVLTAPDNLGYAGGANLGLESTTADLAVVMNPDVEVLPGCLEALSDALNAGASVAGPRFYWDAAKQFQLPPTETVSHGDEVLRLLAERDGFWRRYARRRWRRHSRRFFNAHRPVASFDLSGALMALQRRAWQDVVGPFDEEYALYFEETDWLQRLRRVGGSSLFVPAAEAVHLYAQSTVREGRAQQWFEDSQRRFRRQVYGDHWTRFLESMAHRWAPSGAQDALGSATASMESPHWLEVSSGPKGFPAAVRGLPEGAADPYEIPEDIRRRMAPGRYGLRLVDGRGREGAFRWLDVG